MKETDTVQFEVLTEDGIVSIGRLRLLTEGAIEKDPDPDVHKKRENGLLANDRVLDGIMGEDVRTADGKILKREDDPRVWLTRLPYKYHGTYFWAKFV